MRGRQRDRAMSDLVRERGPALTRYAYLFTGETAAAQDLVQDALVKVFLRTGRGFEPDVLEAYVRRTIVNLSIDRHRRRRAYDERRHLLVAPGSDQGHASGTEDRLDLEAVLGLLSRQERAVVVLRFYEDLTVPRIAREMGLADGTVKRYLSNALTRLEQHLGTLEPPVDDAADVITGPARHGGRS